MNNNNVLFLK